MAASASLSTQYAVRMGLIIVVFTGFTLWCLYDGLVAYPEINRQITALEQQRAEQEKQAEDASGQIISVPHAVQHADGLKPSDRKSDWDIRTQFIMAVMCVLIVVPVALRLIWAWPRRMSTDDDGFRSTAGELIPYSAITRIDKRKWNRKGIAVVHYERQGKERRTRIDDWIFRGGEAVLKEVEAHTGLGDVTPQTPEAAAASEATTATETGS